MLKEIDKETRQRVACYMTCSENKCISAAWRRDNFKEQNFTVEEAIRNMENIGVEIQCDQGNIRIDGELMKNGKQHRGH